MTPFGAINEAGQVVGVANSDVNDANGFPYKHAFLWESGAMVDLGTSDGTSSQPTAINDVGVVVGAVLDARKLPTAFVWQAGTMTEIGTLPGGTQSVALAVNERGQIAGWSTTAAGVKHAVLWTPVTG
jgi:probable HAF family extracellular repeat protein